MQTSKAREVRPGDGAARAPEADRPRSMTTVKLRIAQFATLALILLVWQWASRHMVNPLFISDPLSVIRRLYAWTANGSIFAHVGITLYEAVVGLVLGCAVGILIGIVLGTSTFLSRLLNPYILAFNALPKIALAPLILLWVGLGADSKIVFVAIVVFFLAFFNTFVGVREVDVDLIDTIRVMKAKRWQVLTKVVIPSARTWIFAGLQMSIPYALISAILGEMIASDAGLGYLLVRAGASSDTTGMFAALVIIGVLAVLINQPVDALQRRLDAWKIVFV